jgi:hypothetical protein
MTNEKVYTIAKKLISFFPKEVNMQYFLVRFKNLYTKQIAFFSLFDEESIFKLFVFIYQLTQVDSNLDLNYLILKTEETKIVLTFYTSYTDVFDTCSECDGDGTIDCDYCDGRGDYECSECDGSGQDEESDEECDNCKGTGNESCGNCDGDGSITCDNCGGTGEEEDYQEKSIEVYFEISDDAQVNSELNDYEGTITPLSKVLDNRFKVLNEYDVVVRTENFLEFPEDEKFVKQIFNRPKNKGMILQGMMSYSEFPIPHYFSNM